MVSVIVKKLKTGKKQVLAKLISCAAFTILGYQTIFLIINYPLISHHVKSYKNSTIFVHILCHTGALLNLLYEMFLSKE